MVVILAPLLPVTNSPALVMPPFSIAASSEPDENRAPWLLSEYRAQLLDITYRPLPKRYDRFFRSPTNPIVLTIESPGCIARAKTAGHLSVMRSGESDFLPSVTESNGAQLLIVNHTKTPDYLLTGLIARADLVTGCATDVITTAALLGTPTLPVNSNCGSVAHMLSATQETITQMIERGKQKSQTLLHEITSARPLPRQKEIHVDTYSLDHIKLRALTPSPPELAVGPALRCP